jgi:hypothetical protein
MKQMRFCSTIALVLPFEWFLELHLIVPSSVLDSYRFVLNRSNRNYNAAKLEQNKKKKKNRKLKILDF